MKDLLSLLSLVGCLTLVCATAAAAPSSPNVIFILADDLGWADTTLYGHTKFHKTPNLDRLAKRGMTFSRAYSASPLCSPTRSAILTGLSPARTGITTPNGHVPEIVLKATVGTTGPAASPAVMPKTVTRLATSYATLPKSLQAAGYATAHFGKWHLGTPPYSPLQHGFDLDLPHWPGPGPAGSFVAPWKFKDFDADPGQPNQHIEDRMAKEASAFMEKNKDRPFFVNYWMFSVHAPFDAKKALIEKHRARVNPTSPRTRLAQIKPPGIDRLAAALKKGLPRTAPAVFATSAGAENHRPRRSASKPPTASIFSTPPIPSPPARPCATRRSARAATEQLRLYTIRVSPMIQTVLCSKIALDPPAVAAFFENVFNEQGSTAQTAANSCSPEAMHR